MAGRLRVTQPQRRFAPDDLKHLPRADVRKLMQGLLEEQAAEITDYRRTGVYDDLTVSVPALWSKHTLRIRVVSRVITQADLERFQADLAVDEMIAGWLVAPQGVSGEIASPPSITVMDASELILKLERSANVSWPDRRPQLAIERLGDRRRLEVQARTRDPMGITWLPVLAQNELPSELETELDGPQDWFERIAFRLLTTSLRFGGIRYGEAARGKRLPDAVIHFPGSTTSALLDCKSAADGYQMEADHALRFNHYIEKLAPELAQQGRKLEYMVVLSSDFLGPNDRRHAFHGRSRDLREKTGMELVYIRAFDLSNFASSVEEREFSPAQRESLDWESLMNAGLVKPADFQALAGAI